MSRDLAPDGSLVTCTVGIMAYNEEANIANAIATVLEQDAGCGTVGELIVVASGCTDGTVGVVAELARQDSRIVLIVQEDRAGKASAINLFMKAARSPVLLMVGADTLVVPGTVGHLLGHFQDPGVGMVGGHPVPVNDDETFLGHSVHLVWRLHDRIARRTPKLGEIVAFRNVVGSIPNDTAVDEISIEAAITELGYHLVYEPRAVVYNKGPTTVKDFLRQRRRIAAGHHWVAKQSGYVASTMSVWRIAMLGLRSLIWTAGAIGLEGTARGLGFYDFLRRRPHHIWDAVTTTKSGIASPVIPIRPKGPPPPDSGDPVVSGSSDDVVIDLTAVSRLQQPESEVQEVQSSWA
ncbi:MAG TPA: glycosyltransferase [Acidimicrobiales bacterium]|nr:glycosyltransferase [Acidimicrobiales bacterium]